MLKHFLEIFPFPLFQLSILTLCSGILTSPQVWMSEYSYSVETMDTLEILTFPLHPSSTLLNNSFLYQPNNSQVIVIGNLSYLVFSCEADYPIYWAASQDNIQISSPITLQTLNILKSSPVSMETNSSKLIFTSLMTIFIHNSENNLFTNLHGNWLFSCNDGNQGDLKTTNITLKFGEPRKNPNKLIPVENKMMIAIVTQKSPAAMERANKSYLNIAKVLTHHSSNSDANTDQLIFLSRNISVSWADFLDHLGDDDDDDDDLSFKLTKTLMEVKPNENIVEGDKIQVLCFTSNRFDYAIGSYLEISMETGGPISIIPEEKDENIEGLYGNKRTQVGLSENSVKLAKQLFLSEDNDYDGNKWLSNAHENIIFYLSEEFTLEKGINKIECFMPLWNTGEWDKVATEINVVAK